MSATAAPAIKPASVVPSRTGATADARSAPASDHDFDRRLDAARQQRGHDSAPSDDAQAKPARAGKPDDAKEPAAPAKAADGTDAADTASDAATAAAAMLALLGQSAPAATAPSAPTGLLAAANGPRGALGPLAANGKPAAAETALGALLASATATAAAATTPAAATAATDKFAELLPGIAAPKDEATTALAQLAAQPSALSAAASGNPVIAPAPHLLNLASTVGTPAFTQDLGQQISWLGTQDLKQARIRLHPEDLGPLDIKMSVSHDRVDLTFIAQHPATVHAVQQSLAHLDAMLAQQGMTLGHADVSQQHRGDGSAHGGGSAGAVTEADEAGVAALTPLNCPTPSLLDTFA